MKKFLFAVGMWVATIVMFAVFAVALSYVFSAFMWATVGWPTHREQLVLVFVATSYLFALSDR